MRKNIFITGASSGIGKTIAEYLTTYGHKVIGTSRSISLPGKNIELIPLDVTDDLSVAKAVQLAINELKSIDVLINCAGYGLSGALENTTIKEAKEQFDTNYFGVVRMVNAVLPHFRNRKKGLIINMGSLAGLISMPFQGHYSASKFALEGYTEALRLELRPFNISVCNINPGDFKTNFSLNRKVTGSVTSEYTGKLIQFLEMYNSDEENGSDPVLIAKLVRRLVEKANSKVVRHVIGKRSQTLGVLMKRILGQHLFEKMMIRIWKV